MYTLVSRHSFEVGRKRTKRVRYCLEVVEKLRENAYENGMKDNFMLEQHLHHEDYWMKTPCNVHTYTLNERTKLMSKDSPTVRLSPLLPRYGEHIFYKNEIIICLPESLQEVEIPSNCMQFIQ